MVHDRADSDEIKLTHDVSPRCSAYTGRASQSPLNLLERKGIIRVHRGIISLIDRVGLEELGQRGLWRTGSGGSPACSAESISTSCRPGHREIFWRITLLGVRHSRWGAKSPVPPRPRPATASPSLQPHIAAGRPPLLCVDRGIGHSLGPARHGSLPRLSSMAYHLGVQGTATSVLASDPSQPLTSATATSTRSPRPACARQRSH